ncbi:Aste57867_12365 [Aphanomyces stellatus]|uniref:Aste57867_12365 protein n=1 Tax=Aphanomyces stellatus TaxID=120398 RepID=A0A485KVZ8_9STRA|nr:hypothetical protein As57867_012319 [Aphanomyces stellatus]VFT89217.1 Aste57867_12365 [Aphanomyces stellatus]
MNQQTIVVATTSAAIGAAAIYSLQRWLRVKPFIPTLPLPVHLHRFFSGVGESFSSVEATWRLMVDEADEDGMCQFYLVGMPCVSVLRAPHVRTVLLASNYRRRSPFFDDFVDAFLGSKGLIQLQGHEWKIHRRLIAKAFQWQNLVGMAPTMGAIADAFVDRVLLPRTMDTSIDIFPLIKLATLDVLGATAFGTSFNAIDHSQSNPIVEAFTFLLDDMNRRAFDAPLDPASSLYWLPTAANREFHRHTLVLRTMIDRLVASRLVQPDSETKDTPNDNRPHDLLQCLVDAAAADASGAITPQSFADNLLTFLFAGYDTTSIALAYTLYALATHPHIQAKAVAEIHAVLGTDTPSYDDAQRLVYCTAIVTESLRLYPPVLMTLRTLEAPLRLGRHDIPTGTSIFLPIDAIQRDCTNWGPDADAFRPERHLQDDDDIQDGMSAKDKAYRFVAFSGGPRNCVGMRFAMLEATILLAVFLRRCAFTRPDDAPPVIVAPAGLVQKPQHGIWLRVALRS